jgi:hypothetical protein
MVRWEYKTLKLGTKGFLGGKLDEVELETKMNELGKDGWELVSAFDTNQSHGETRDVIVMFKRRTDYYVD